MIAAVQALVIFDVVWIAGALVLDQVWRRFPTWWFLWTVPVAVGMGVVGGIILGVMGLEGMEASVGFAILGVWPLGALVRSTLDTRGRVGASPGDGPDARYVPREGRLALDQALWATTAHGIFVGLGRALHGDAFVPWTFEGERVGWLQLESVVRYSALPDPSQHTRAALERAVAEAGTWARRRDPGAGGARLGGEVGVPEGDVIWTPTAPPEVERAEHLRVLVGLVAIANVLMLLTLVG